MGWDYSVRPTCQLIQVNAPRLLNLSQAGRCTWFTYPTRMEGWGDLVAGYIPRWLTCPQTVIHPASNRLTRPNWKLNQPYNQTSNVVPYYTTKPYIIWFWHAFNSLRSQNQLHLLRFWCLVKISTCFIRCAPCCLLINKFIYSFTHSMHCIALYCTLLDSIGNVLIFWLWSTECSAWAHAWYKTRDAIIVTLE